MVRSLDHVICACNIVCYPNDVGVSVMWSTPFLMTISVGTGKLKATPQFHPLVHHWQRSTLSARRSNSTSRRHDEIFRSCDLSMWHGHVIHVMCSSVTWTSPFKMAISFGTGKLNATPQVSSLSSPLTKEYVARIRNSTSRLHDEMFRSCYLCMWY